MIFERWPIRRALLVTGAALALAGCGAGGNDDDSLDPMRGVPTPKVESKPLDPVAGAQAPAATVGEGSVKVALVLPSTASGNAGLAAQSMRNAAELALAEFNTPDVQLIVKDDGGTAQGAQAAVQDATAQGARLVIGPLFAHTVAGAGQVAKQKNVPVLAFSTDANVASHGVFLLSFMPESDVNRVVGYAASQGKRSFAALLPDTAYGSVVEGAFQQAVTKAGGRVVGIEHYAADKSKMSEPIARLASSLPQADALFIPSTAEDAQTIVGQLATNGVNTKRLQLLGTGLWDDPALARDESLSGAWYAGPDDSGFNAFSKRYRAKYGQDPVRTATLSYDATALVAALVKSQGADSLNDDTFTNPSGFSGVDGAFRFRSDGSNERALAVYQVQTGGPKVISAPPRGFAGSTAQAN